MPLATVANASSYTWLNPEAPPKGNDYMKLRLVYEGQLKSSNNRTPADVQIVRQYLHPQLHHFWKTQYPAKSTYDHEVSFPAVAKRLTTNAIHYLPLVSNYFGNICSLDILLLRRGKLSKQIFSPTGDIDNQITTLFDALKWPSTSDNVGNIPDKPIIDRDIPVMFCLVEDDKLITEIKVTADMLHTPAESTVKHPENDVLAIIEVTTSSNGSIQNNWAGF